MNLTAPPADALETKQHFEILDGLRGVAVICVVVFHFMELAVPEYEDNFIAHAYLAVDFFFCLSGFVIAYAYDNKLKTIGIAAFLKLRLIRLHPLVIIGSVIGLLMFVFDPFSNLYSVYGPGKTLMMFLTSCLLVPYPLITERYFNLFHLNPPTWSLFWEYIANIAYALVFYRLTKNILLILTIVAAGLLFYEASRSANLSVGWGGDNIIGGGIRVLFSFLAGMLVWRSKWIINSSLGIVPLAVLLMVAFLFPFVKLHNWLTDFLLVVIYFPLLIVLGAGARLKPGLVQVCKFSGEISYPLYMVHYPFIWLFMSYQEKYKPSMALMSVIIPVGTLLLIGFAYFIWKYVDVPVRRYLRRVMF